MPSCPQGVVRAGPFISQPGVGSEDFTPFYLPIAGSRLERRGEPSPASNAYGWVGRDDSRLSHPTVGIAGQDLALPTLIRDRTRGHRAAASPARRRAVARAARKAPSASRPGYDHGARVGYGPMRAKSAAASAILPWWNVAWARKLRSIFRRGCSSPSHSSHQSTAPWRTCRARRVDQGPQSAGSGVPVPRRPGRGSARCAPRRGGARAGSRRGPVPRRGRRRRGPGAAGRR